MILIGLGANLESALHGRPRHTLPAALAAMASAGLAIEASSSWYESAPVPASDQPWYVNGVASVRTTEPPGAVLALLHEIEAAFGRQRGLKDAARVLDLDLLAYDNLVLKDWPILPHPRLASRGFVLLPLQEMAPDWRHPVSGETVAQMLAKVDPSQITRRLP